MVSTILQRTRAHQQAGTSGRCSPTALQGRLTSLHRSSKPPRRRIVARADDEGPLGSGKLGQAVEDSYEEGTFDEGAAQVQRLLFRDRKELTGIEDIGQGFQTEFDDEGSEQKVRQPKASSAKQENGAKEASPKPSSFTSGKAASPFGKPSGGSPFGTPSKVKASSAAKPFSGAGNQNLFKEMDNLSPFMQPDQMEEKPWWQNISLGQVLIVLSFTLIIGLMIGTFAVVYKAGGIHFNE